MHFSFFDPSLTVLSNHLRPLGLVEGSFVLQFVTGVYKSACIGKDFLSLIQLTPLESTSPKSIFS